MLQFGVLKVSGRAVLEPTGSLLKRETGGALQSCFARSACSSKGLSFKKIVCNTSNPKCFLQPKFIIKVHVCRCICFQWFTCNKY